MGIMGATDTNQRTLVAVTVTADTARQMQTRVAEAAKTGADVVELRLDYLRDLTEHDVRDLVAGRPCPVIVTVRAAWEGGRFGGKEADRLGLLKTAAQAGAEYIDLEYVTWRDSRDSCKHLLQACRKNGRATQLILSQHDFKRTPGDLEALLAELAASDADIIKLATQARHINDSLRMLEALRCAGKPAIGVCMGACGVMTRILAGKAGAYLTYCCLEAGEEAAPGQVPAGDMLTMYRFRQITDKTAVLGVVGCPVAHSMSPALHNAAYEELGIDAVYLPFEVAEGEGSFNRFLGAILAAGWLSVRGLSVTIPHKLAALKQADEVEPLTAKIGAANTLVLDEGGRIEAYNTDYAAAMRALCEGADLRPEDLAGKTVAVLGAGGVSRAVVAGLTDAGCEVTICNRTVARAQELAEEFGCQVEAWDDRGRLRPDILVNCTSLGMWPNQYETPMPKEALQPGTIVFDTVYNPPETRLLLHAAVKGCRLVDGVAMFVDQGALQMQHWFGRSGALGRMRQVVLDRLRRHQ
jgi:3-dehydroquinate dehydratase/shikimate dehydrogenase